MRLILALPILLVVACGAAFGALNGGTVPIDFHFIRIHAPIGVALLAALLAGWLLGGLVAWFGHGRLRRRLRARRLQSAATRDGAP